MAALCDSTRPSTTSPRPRMALEGGGGRAGPARARARERESRGRSRREEGKFRQDRVGEREREAAVSFERERVCVCVCVLWRKVRCLLSNTAGGTVAALEKKKERRKRKTKENVASDTPCCFCEYATARIGRVYVCVCVCVCVCKCETRCGGQGGEESTALRQRVGGEKGRAAGGSSARAPLATNTGKAPIAVQRQPRSCQCPPQAARLLLRRRGPCALAGGRRAARWRAQWRAQRRRRLPGDRRGGEGDGGW